MPFILSLGVWFAEFKEARQAALSLRIWVCGGLNVCDARMSNRTLETDRLVPAMRNQAQAMLPIVVAIAACRTSLSEWASASTSALPGSSPHSPRTLSLQIRRVGHCRPRKDKTHSFGKMVTTGKTDNKVFGIDEKGGSRTRIHWRRRPGIPRQRRCHGFNNRCSGRKNPGPESVTRFNLFRLIYVTGANWSEFVYSATKIVAGGRVDVDAN